MSESMSAGAPGPIFGWTGFLIGAAALLGALYVFWAGPFAPQQSTGVSLGELAAEIGKSTLRSVAGRPQPAPQPVPNDLDDTLRTVVALVGGLAVILSLVGLIRREALRPALGGAVLGIGAILFQFFAWAVMALLGVLLVMALLHSFGDVFRDLFGG